jgi:hypothetical protein
MPASFTPSFSKNVIRRSLRAVLDKHPSDAEVMRLWRHFDDHCAYCDESIPQGSTQARLDHLVSGGTNHISNRVPACAQCNDEEKRDAPWEPFLKSKTPAEQFEVRKKRILDWVASASIAGGATTDPSAAAEDEIEAVIAAYDAALTKIRASRNGKRERYNFPP